MTPEQLALVRSTAPVVEAASDEFARRFYDRLAELCDGATRMSPLSRRRQLVDDVVFLAAVATDLDAFVERAHTMGVRHHSYGAHACDYPVFGEALMAAAAAVLADRWTPAMATAWRRLYDLMAEAMLEGASRSLFIGRS